jgi:hypothetical protein
MREKESAPKSNVLTSRSPVANPKSDPDYSMFIISFLLFYIPPKDVFAYPRRCSYAMLKTTGLAVSVWCQLPPINPEFNHLKSEFYYHLQLRGEGLLTSSAVRVTRIDRPIAR